ncbi:hypothetical protein BCR34DRAFT_589837 [Clohesyomyces aquaticus]|uniref:Uncharacterized protein n=1 Tax=Clohesyomyces aquaticus TaxID=1231657 RepID=A0A1Y1ZFM6_9PLEO|nr:hypothetical protein BCR34DRAFT_589837 [Clohesyomyces aquaticus]
MCNDKQVYYTGCGHSELKYGGFCQNLFGELQRINNPRELNRPGIPFQLGSSCQARTVNQPGFCQSCSRRYPQQRSRWPGFSGSSGGYGGAHGESYGGGYGGGYGRSYTSSYFGWPW